MVSSVSQYNFCNLQSALNGGCLEALFDRNQRKSHIKNRSGEAAEVAVFQSKMDFRATAGSSSNELMK